MPHLQKYLSDGICKLSHPGGIQLCFFFFLNRFHSGLLGKQNTSQRNVCIYMQAGDEIVFEIHYLVGKIQL